MEKVFLFLVEKVIEIQNRKASQKCSFFTFATETVYHGKVSVSVFYLWPLLHFVSVSGKRMFRQRQNGTLVIRMYMVLSRSPKTNFKNFVSGKVYFLSVSFSHKCVVIVLHQTQIMHHWPTNKSIWTMFDHLWALFDPLWALFDPLWALIYLLWCRFDQQSALMDLKFMYQCGNKCKLYLFYQIHYLV